MSERFIQKDIDAWHELMYAGYDPSVSRTPRYEQTVTQDRILMRGVAPRPPHGDDRWQLVSVVLETDGFRTYYWQREVK